MSATQKPALRNRLAAQFGGKVASEIIWEAFMDSLPVIPVRIECGPVHAERSEADHPMGPAPPIRRTNDPRLAVGYEREQRKHMQNGCLISDFSGANGMGWRPFTYPLMMSPQPLARSDFYYPVTQPFEANRYSY